MPTRPLRAPGSWAPSGLVRSAVGSEKKPRQAIAQPSPTTIIGQRPGRLQIVLILPKALNHHL